AAGWLSLGRPRELSGHRGARPDGRGPELEARLQPALLEEERLPLIAGGARHQSTHLGQAGLLRRPVVARLAGRALRRGARRGGHSLLRRRPPATPRPPAPVRRGATP